MVTTEELINVPGLDPEQKVVIRKLGMGSLTKLRSKSVLTNVKHNGNVGGPETNVDIGLYTKWILIFGIKEAPFFEGCRTYEDRERAFDNDVMETETGEFLFQKIQVLNRFQKIEELKKK